MKIYKMILIVFGVLGFMTAPAFSVEYYLRADYTTITVPDANNNPINIPMWGFALDSAFDANDGIVMVPGPLLTVPVGDPNLTIHLDNNLNVPVSIIINGQNAVMTPVKFTDPNGRERIRSLTYETDPNNSTPVDYVWNNFKPGSYIYQTGSHIAVGVQMGLYGGAIKDYAVTPYQQVYQNIVYDVNVPLFFSEIDPALHFAVDSNNYGPGKLVTSTVNYEPKYYLINGAPFDPNDPNQILPAGSSGGGTLLRLFNMGLETRSILLQGSYMFLIAEDGQPYKYPRQQYAALLTAGKTIDAMVAFPDAGTYPVYDRRLGLTNDTLSGGGMLRYLNVTAGNMWPVINSITATPASILDTQTSQLQVNAVDTDGPSPLSYSWDIPVGAGSLDDPTIANPVFTPNFVASTQTYTFTVTVSDGLHVDIGTVDVTVRVNVPPVINSVTADPNVITDLQTSQLMVNATDTDGPSPLSYNWIVPVGAGSVSDPTIANPIYTPPDVNANQIFTLTVEVSDGIDTVSDTVDVNVSNVIVFQTIYEAEDAVLSGPVVATAISGYSGTGYADYINASGDYIEWTVNVPSAGQYELKFYYGLLSGNRPLEVRVNGAVVSASLSFPATGSWSNWQFVSVIANLNAGSNTVRTTAIGASGPNVDYLELAAYAPPTNIYEAEDAVLSGAVVSTAVAGYSGTGFADYVNASGDYIEWTVNAATAGDYELIFHYGLASGDRPLEVRVNGAVVAASQSFPATGAWSNWQTVTVVATLNAGSNTVRTTAIGASGPNVDYLEIVEVVAPLAITADTYEAENAVLNGAVVSTVIGGFSGSGFVDYINPSGDYIEWTVNAPAAGSYDLIFRYGLSSGDRPLEVRLNGAVVVASQSFPSTGGWSNWMTVTTTQILNAGSNTIRLTAIGSSGPNVDKLDVLAN